MSSLTMQEQKFASIFGNYGWQWILKNDAFNWLTQKRYAIKPKQLIDLWRDVTQFVGVRFGKTTNYAVIDIDAGSRYHTDRGLRAIKAALESIGLVRSILIQSSNSGGWHLYFPLPESVNSFNLACTIRYTSEEQGLKIQGGQLEQFPNCKAFNSEYNGHRLPLQTGSYLLDADFQEYSQSLESFLTAWDSAAACQDMAALKDAIANAPKVKTYKLDGKNDDWCKHLESMIEIGWTDKSQSNGLLHAIAQYHRVFKAVDDEQELVDATVTTAKNTKGFYEYSSHVDDLQNRAEDIAKNVMIKNWCYGNNRSSTKSDRPKIDKPNYADRLMAAIEQIKNQTFTTTRSLLEALAKLLKTSLTTLYKFRKLWKPLLNNCNAASSDDSSDLVEHEIAVYKTSQNSETFTESGVTVQAPNEVCLTETFSLNPEPQTSIPVRGVSKFFDENSEPIQDKEFKQIMTFEQQIAIASTCPTSRSPEPQNFRLPKEPPRQNPSTLESVRAAVEADPRCAVGRLAMLQMKAFLPALSANERSQTEQAIAYLEKLLAKDPPE